MPTHHEYLLITAAVCLLLSLSLAWLASLIIYAKIVVLKRCFPATNQLIRSHIDYLLMTGLLVVTHYMVELNQVILPTFIVFLTCAGALYNPFGFFVLAIKPSLSQTNTTFEKARVLIGFLPATIGYGYSMIVILKAML